MPLLRGMPWRRP